MDGGAATFKIERYKTVVWTFRIDFNNENVSIMCSELQGGFSTSISNPTNGCSIFYYGRLLISLLTHTRKKVWCRMLLCLLIQLTVRSTTLIWHEKVWIFYKKFCGELDRFRKKKMNNNKHFVFHYCTYATYYYDF